MTREYIQLSRGCKQCGIYSGLVEYLDDLDYTDDLAVLACTQAQIRKKTDKASHAARRVGLEINASKSKSLHVKPASHLGNVISKDGSAQKDIKSRLSKARNTFANLRPVWRSFVYSKQTKLHLYNSIVKSVLLYGSECWQVPEAYCHKIEAFHNGSLRRISRIFWPRTISNFESHAKKKSKPIQISIKMRRLRWLGHILRMSPNWIPRVTLRCTP